WFHSSHAYGNGKVIETLKKAFAESPRQRPKMIFKIDGLDVKGLQESVEGALSTGVDRIDIGQVCGNPPIEELQPGRPMHDALARLLEQGKVGHLCMEIFWQFSPNALRCLQANIFNSYTYYFNAVNREVSNELYDELQRRQTPILALRTLGGGPESYWGTPDAAAAKTALDAIYAESGCATKLEFRCRFILSFPNTRTTIGASSKPDHLQALLGACAGAKPLAAGIISRIEALHREWFATAGLR
ncbi:MAG TPA: hypothetical protein VIL86_11375, partial [Tepidisphaeraceae bacterium]